MSSEERVGDCEGSLRELESSNDKRDKFNQYDSVQIIFTNLINWESALNSFIFTVRATERNDFYTRPILWNGKLN